MPAALSTRTAAMADSIVSPATKRLAKKKKRLEKNESGANQLSITAIACVYTTRRRNAHCMLSTSAASTTKP